MSRLKDHRRPKGLAIVLVLNERDSSDTFANSVPESYSHSKDLRINVILRELYLYSEGAMKSATLLVLFLTLGTVLTFAQGSTNTNLTQCRDLAETGNFVGSDEVLVNGKVCKVQKVTATPPAQRQPAESHPMVPATATVQPPKHQTSSASSAAPSSEVVNAEGSPQPVPARVGSSPAPTVQRPPAVPNSPTATITFVTIQNGNVAHLMPDWAIKWVRKNERKYPGVRFQTSGEPVAGARNFVVAFSPSSAEVQGFQPVTHTDT